MARKTQRRPDKIELGVVDIHTHVLPGIDDGAEKMALSYRMLRRSYKPVSYTHLTLPTN